MDPKTKPLEFSDEYWEEQQEEESAGSTPESNLFLFLTDLSSSYTSQELSL